MTKRAWTMRPLEPTDVGAFRDLYHELHGFHRPAAYDDWFFNGNVCGFPIGMVATADSRLAGVYMLTPVDILVGGRRVRGAQSVDTMTAPDFRNQGIFVALATATVERAAAEGCQVLYGLPNENSYPGFVRRLAWTHTGNIVRWLRILAPGKLGRAPAIVARAFDAIALRAPTLAWGGYSIRFDPLLDEVVSDLLSQPLGEASACMIARDSRWMGWRYSEATSMDYEWVSAWRDGRCLGAALWGMRNEAWKEARSDRAKLVEVAGHDVGAAAVAVGIAARRAALRGATAIETLSTSPFVDRIMKRCWFLPYGKPPLIVKRLVEADQLSVDVYDHSRWRIRGGDSDTF